MANQTHTPHLTVGIMAYNEELYLAETIKSILQQEFSDYEIIIADNASEDRTGVIALEYAHNQPHIHYIRHPRNIGALQNFNSLVAAARGEYFVLAGAHDLWSKNFLTKLVAALDQNPDAVLAYAPTIWIDDVGQPLDKSTGFIDTSGYNPVTRFNLIMWGDQHSIYGLYRLEALRKTRLQLQIVGSGAVMLSELAILGSFTVVPDVTWFRRVNRSPETQEERIARYAKVLFVKRPLMILPHWRIPLAYLTAVLRGKMSFGQRILLILSVSNSLLRYGRAMIWDIRQLIRRGGAIFRGKNTQLTLFMLVWSKQSQISHIFERWYS